MSLKIATLLFLLIGAINFAPIAGVLGQSSLERLYGLDNLSEEVLILLKHRAVLLAIIGGFLMVSAFHRPCRKTASACAYVSMLSFVAIFWMSGLENQTLAKIAYIDVVAIIALFGASILDRQSVEKH